jgi:glycosyltransferase involved in cell wall biosynthesis
LQYRGRKPLIACVLDGGGREQPNACAYIRLILPLTQPLVRSHFDVRFINAVELPYFRPDVVIAQRLAFNSQGAIEGLLAHCRKTNAGLIYEIDDDLLSIGEDHAEYRHYRAAAEFVRSASSQAKEVWVSTSGLAEKLNGLNPNVIVLQNSLDDRIWTLPAERAADDVARILYMGTISHSDDFRSVFLPAFQKLKARFGDRIEATLVGVLPDWRESRGIASLAVPTGVGVAYPAFASWLQASCQQNIGVAPLTDAEFNRSKSHIKWLEYSALGLATVASNVGEYAQSVVQGSTGLLAGASSADFEDTLAEAVTNASLRAEVARNARNVAAQQLDDSRQDQRRIARLSEMTGLEIDTRIL